LRRERRRRQFLRELDIRLINNVRSHSSEDCRDAAAGDQGDCPVNGEQKPDQAEAATSFREPKRPSEGGT
jgi:hypothetical protein